jgi:hypothetical protein
MIELSTKSDLLAVEVHDADLWDLIDRWEENPPSWSPANLSRDLWRTQGDAGCTYLWEMMRLHDPTTADEVIDAAWLAGNRKDWTADDQTIVDAMAECGLCAGAAHRNATDFAAPNPPFEDAVAFAQEHAEAKHDQSSLSFHWSALAWDLRRRYGDRGRQIFEAGLAGYPTLGRASAHDETCENTDHPGPQYSDESLVTRMRRWRKNKEISRRVANVRLSEALDEKIALAKTILASDDDLMDEQEAALDAADAKVAVIRQTTKTLEQKMPKPHLAVVGGVPLPAPGPYNIEEPIDEAASIVARPFVWRDPSTIPEMPWLYGRHYLRGCVSLTVAASGGGKTFRKIADALAMVTGRMLLHDQPVGKLRVWMANGEEPADILERRFAATRLLHKLSPEDTGDRLYVTDRTMKCIIAKQTRDGVTIMEPVRDKLVAEIREKQIDVLQIDPFISAHAVSENDNAAIDQVIKQYADVAQETGCAIDLSHHPRKTGGAAVGIEDSRGASSAIGAVRCADTMNFMSVEEAKAAGIEDRHRYIRVDDAKPNHAPRAEKAQWLKFESVYLGNGPDATAGDSIGALKRWTWPDPMTGVTTDDLAKAQAAVGAGKWRADVQAEEWVGKPIAEALGLDLDKSADKARVKGMIKQWIATKALVVVKRKDDRRRERDHVEVGPTLAEAKRHFIITPPPALPA